MVSLVQKGAQILSAGALDTSMLSRIDIESIIYNPNALLQSHDWMPIDESAEGTAASKRSMMLNDNTIVRVNIMGGGLPHHRLARSRAGAGASAGVEPGSDEICFLTSADPFFSKAKPRKRNARANDDDDSGMFLPLNELDPSAKKARRGGASSVGAAAAASSSGRVCKIETCGHFASNKSPYCADHSGTRRCQFPDCTKCAQGATRFCIA
jgi:hypothetical protein